MGRQRRRACPALPQDFVGRCEALGSATLVHVPNPAREELCAIFCDGLEEMLHGDENWSKIAQCTHRLLLGAVPKGFNPTSELRTRLGLWRSDRLEELLTRREQQRRGIVESRNGHTSGHHTDSSVKRAERLAREGARSKAIGGLKGGIKSLPAERQRTWAAKLIPTPERGDGAFAELRPVEGSQGEDASQSGQSSGRRGFRAQGDLICGDVGAGAEWCTTRASAKFLADQAEVRGESASARLGDLPGACVGRRPAGWGTLGSALSTHLLLQAWV